ncbi:hypothetical protein H4S07_001964 [Coemansia furcata]|uniref:Uncharacterized protein n=1 Tax=Coemansia furcata TaxID=417177 RepID=A0ACC1LMA3_9FUNG|nr:hypothetical protein H4S07_001964 [Coemansia furcata]
MSRMLWPTATRQHALLRYYSTRTAPISSARRQQTRHRSVGDQISELSRQSTEVASAGSEQRTVELMTACHQLLLTHITTISPGDTLRLCQVADMLGQQTMQQRDAVSLSPELFTRYVEFYAHLGRPDITQHAFSRVQRQWRQPSAAAYAAQQLALLRFAGDCATGHALLGKTAMPGQSGGDLAGRVNARLVARSVAAVVGDVMRHERRTRRVVRALEYASYAAVAALVAKWAWIGNSAMQGMGLAPRVLASVAALLVAGASVRWALRRSVMGTLTTPVRGVKHADQKHADQKHADQKPATADTGADAEALRILRRAFPASPSDDAMEDIGDMLYADSPQPRLSRPLRLALAWSRLARRFAVVEPMLPSPREMHRRLAASWIRSLVRMFPLPSSSSPSAGRQRVASEALRELVAFARAHFHAAAPLPLPHAEIAALSAFAAQEANAEEFADFLRLVAAGALGLARSADPPALNPGDGVAKQRAAAVVLTYITCIQRLTHREKLRALIDSLQSNAEMPVSAALYRAAFAAADHTLGDADAAHALAASLEARFLANDAFVRHIARSSNSPALGWKLHSAADAPPPPPPPIVRCLAPYVALLARQGSLVDAVDRWVRIGLLSPAAAVHCLAQPLPPAESCAVHACHYAAMLPKKDLSALPLDALLLAALAAACDEPSAARILAAWRQATDRQPALKALASTDLNSQVVAALAALSLSAQNEQAKEQAKEYALMARDALAHMLYMGQTPTQVAWDRLRQAAMRAGVHIPKELQDAPTTKKHAENKNISAFAKSLF